MSSSGAEWLIEGGLMDGGTVTRPCRLLDRLPRAADFLGDDTLLVCPWLEGLDLETGPWLAALSIHDCNAYLEGDWTFIASPAERERCYFGVFALDRLRSQDGLFALLRRRGVDAIVNLPSITFFDGATAQTLDSLGFDAKAEARFLDKARRHGFRAALCVRAGDDRAGGNGACVLHEGPGHPFSFIR
ncbi:hypothetical protein [Chelatococcus asaccharovorans]|uniref:hypothetical protein n=1 Tax=Chelatococcus asaccharovorans TaxID=28210 RepID=UPI00224C6DC6|nr:hypothetical protein [Chelatococcus asaccharovorans]CAH1657812.1 Phosphoenolpyruvate hydrolase-like protein [Chelatococcus asaccharovorans]CAH1687440.1 Phosphoenolpyruvate hydrolase-like protein [Chelatococcus asaccharovorans]